jgi:hypothetical protein
MTARERKLAAVVAGTAKPANALESLELADFAVRWPKRYAEGLRLFTEGLTADPKLGDDPRNSRRYNAACSAALTAAGQGKDAKPLDDKARGQLRRQALDWLRADLTAWQAIATKGPDKVRAEVKLKMAEWQKDADLAGLRDPAALANLPDAERGDWEKMWAEVRKLAEGAK